MMLRTALLAVLGGKRAEAARWLREEPRPCLPLSSGERWDNRVWAAVLDSWLRLIRGYGSLDANVVFLRILCLRKAQLEAEPDYLRGLDPEHAQAAALELIGLYHLAATADLVAGHQGGREQTPGTHQLLGDHFTSVRAVCAQARLMDLDPLSRLLEAGAARMVPNAEAASHMGGVVRIE